MWFEKMTGFREESPEQVRKNISISGNILRSNVNGKEYVFGSLEIPCLGDLRKRVLSQSKPNGKITVREVVGDVQALHLNKSSSNALFQVASQFNLLEMVSPNVTPEQGVGRYENDHTQGPACAISASAGTIYRNYFVPVNGQVGQSENNQIDCLADIGIAMGNSAGRLWEMRNGYVLATEEGLVEISNYLRNSNDYERDKLRGLLRIGIQWGTQVTINGSQHKVSQAYCSALPIAYSEHSPLLWEDFAKVILEAAYEAILCVAILNFRKTGNNMVFLTLLGGGSFGNDTSWIIQGIKRAIELYSENALDVVIVSNGASNSYVKQFIREFEYASNNSN